MPVGRCHHRAECFRGFPSAARVATVLLIVAGCTGTSVVGADVPPSRGGTSDNLVTMDSREVFEALQVVAPTGGNSPHLIGAALGANGRLFVGAFGEGIGTADFDLAAPSVPVTYHPHPGNMCARILVGPGTVYCTAHDTGRLLVLDYDDAADTLGNPRNVPTQAVGLEGMALVDGRALVAARDRGVMALDTSGARPTLVSVTSPDALDDAWDLRPYGTDHLVVADGAHGLRVLRRSGDGHGYALVGALALPGMSVAVRVSGDRAYVAALAGGGHVVDLSVPAAPVYLGTLAADRMVYDLMPSGDLVLAAAGDTLVAGRRGTGTTFAIVGEHRTTGYAMGLRPLADGTVAAMEFETITRYRIHPDAASDEVLHFPQALAVAMNHGPGAVQLDVPIRSVGRSAVHVDGIVGDGTGTLPGGFGTPFDLAPGATLHLALPVESSPMGGYLRGIRIESPAVIDGDLAVEATSSLQPGDPFPQSLPLIQSDGTAYDLTRALAGKVSVVLVATSACPVAFYSLTEAGLLLAPYLHAGQIAAAAIDAWRTAPRTPNVPSPFNLPFPHLYWDVPPETNLHASSPILDRLGQTSAHDAPMPDIYVLDREGRVTYASWRLDPVALDEALTSALAR